MLAPYVRGFIRAGLFWLAVGIAIGIGMAWWPADHLAYRPAHAHANLLGFLSMFVFGVGYHVLPRFVGEPLSAAQAGWATRQLWIQNAGLVLMEAGWLARPWHWDIGQWLLMTGAPLSMIGAGIFIAIAWRLAGTGGGVELRPPGR